MGFRHSPHKFPSVTSLTTNKATVLVTLVDNLRRDLDRGPCILWSSISVVFALIDRGSLLNCLSRVGVEGAVLK